MTTPTSPSRIAIIGGGPAGLMAAETLVELGHQVAVFDGMPSMGRKFLLAGVGGLNLTHSEPRPAFVARYAERAGEIEALLGQFSPHDLCDWAEGLGIETFIGSSGRIFPLEMKAAPLLRAWLHRLRASGVQMHVRHRWQGWSEDGGLRFNTPSGEIQQHFDACILALGGASWPRLGSDGSWQSQLAARQIQITPLKPANCGFEITWSDHLRQKFAGSPLKTITLSFAGETRAGECMIAQHGIEGSLIYAFSARLRETIAQDGHATILLDLCPGRDAARVLQEVSQPRGARSLSSHLQSKLGLTGIKVGLLNEVLSRAQLQDPAQLAATIKALPLRLDAPRPINEAISSAGGVRFEEMDQNLMVKSIPGLFCAGEMLDWEAPTGGYLLSACFASGRVAGLGAHAWLQGSMP